MDVTKIIKAINMIKDSKLQDDFSRKDKQGHPIETVYEDENKNIYIVVVYRPSLNDYAVGYGYDINAGDWKQGYYGFNSKEEAKRYVERNYGNKYNLRKIKDSKLQDYQYNNYEIQKSEYGWIVRDNRGKFITECADEREAKEYINNLSTKTNRLQKYSVNYISRRSDRQAFYEVEAASEKEAEDKVKKITNDVYRIIRTEKV